MEVDFKDSFTPKARRDYRLVRNAIESDSQHAYTELMENYKESLYVLMFKMVNNPYDAEDLTIEAFGKAFHNLSQYTSDYAFSTWLFKIASNNCIDFLKKKRLHLYEMDKDYMLGKDDPFSFELNDDKPNPEERLFDKEKSSEIRRLVNTLKPRYRKLIELRYFEELSYNEIATLLDLPLGSVKAMLFRARYMLQAIVKKGNI
ncbi:MAG: sigma-70 family RNA polymerase sigma factor [Tannerellaceae bacterium]|jgi:RNA polymerase sigma-70 factor (ECF subfamily)|nr:sigma-70 family RNA polymerase sigma factor [Tannerellaceae bacterium]